MRHINVALGAGGTAPASTFSGHGYGPSPVHNKKPITMTVFSPGSGDVSGAAGAGFIVDLALDATARKDNPLLSATGGYKPFFSDPNATTFHPGPPGLPASRCSASTGRSS